RSTARQASDTAEALIREALARSEDVDEIGRLHEALDILETAGDSLRFAADASINPGAYLNLHNVMAVNLQTRFFLFARPTSGTYLAEGILHEASHFRDFNQLTGDLRNLLEASYVSKRLPIVTYISELKAQYSATHNIAHAEEFARGYVPFSQRSLLQGQIN